jgi:S-adenosylmethionine-diacylglycerol 3-amino-3-carboxypropyl transferase
MQRNVAVDTVDTQVKGGKLIGQAAVSARGLSASALLERAFAFAFRGLVYPQIWEDPVADMEGLAIGPGDHVVTIASGGCNALSYLTADPGKITAIDLNSAHIALNRLKQTALSELPDHAHFRRFFGAADTHANVAAYHRWIAPQLDVQSRKYWEARDVLGRERIGMFAKGFYRYGLLGMFIGLAHAIARLQGRDPREMLAARTTAQQRELFDQRLAPLFDRRLIRWLTSNPASLFGLGIPPAQYEKLCGGRHMADVLRERLGKLCCDFPLSDNYFAWQALSRGYEPGPDASVPPYLQEQHYAALREMSPRVDVVQANLAEWLAGQQANSADRFILLDAQDWMTDAQLDTLWSQICRTARPGARVLFRTADEPDLLPGRVAAALLEQWEYCEARSRELTAMDRSSIYGGVHLYIRRD